MLAKVKDSVYFSFEDRVVMEISSFIEMFEIQILYFCFSVIRSDGKVHFIFLSDIIFEFLFNFNLSKSSFQIISLNFYKFRKVIRNFLI